MKSLLNPAHPGKPELTISAVLGGNGADLLHYWEDLCHADIGIYADTENEVSKYLTVFTTGNVIACRLGKGQTARTLAKRAQESVQRWLARAAGMNVDCGMGQVRAWGYLGAIQSIESREVQDFLQHGLPELLRQVSGGVVGNVRIIGKGSVAGGTGSSGLTVFLTELEKAILKWSDATTIHTEYHVCGSVSYSGLGRRVHRNGAAGTAEILANVLFKDQPDRVIRSLRLAELPPVGEDRELRSRFMLEVEQAAECPEVRKLRAQWEPNASQDGPLGNITLLRSVHHAALDPRFDIARDIAPEYATTIRRITAESRPQPSLIQRLVLNTRQHSIPRAELEGIVDRAAATDGNELVGLITQQAARIIGTVDALLATGDTVRLSEAATVWATSPSTVAETTDRLILQQSCLQILDHEIAALEARLAQAQHQGVLLARSILRAIASAQRPSLWARLTRNFTTPAPLSEQLLAPATQLRRIADLQHQYKAEIEILQTARNAVAAERDFIIHRLAAMAAGLESAIPRGQQHHCSPTVVARHIDSVFGDLWALGSRPDADAVARLLVRAVDHVTEFGLVKITAADPQRLEAVASQIVQLNGTITPPWGGKDRPLDGWTVHVLPPVSHETGEKIRQLVRAQRCQAPVVVAERMPASLNCVSLIFTQVFDLENDIFTQLFQSSLTQVYFAPNRDIYLPTGIGALGQVGIAEKDNDLHFDGLSDQGVSQ